MVLCPNYPYDFPTSEEDDSSEENDVDNEKEEKVDEDDDGNDEDNTNKEQFTKCTMKLLKRFFPSLSAVQRKKIGEDLWNGASTLEEDEYMEDGLEDNSEEFWEFMECSMPLMKHFFPSLLAIQRKDLSDSLWQIATSAEDND